MTECDTLTRNVEITAMTRLKHSAILKAVRQCGGLDKFAERVGISRSIAIRLQNLQWCVPEIPRKHWTRERIDQLQNDIAELSGTPVSDLFPRELRDAVEVGVIGRTIEQTRKIPLAGLIAYTQRRKKTLTLPSPHTECESLELKSDICELLKTIPERERLILEMRFGLGKYSGDGFTLDEVGRIFGIHRERVRQIECRAIRRLQMRSQHLKVLSGHLE